MKKQFLLLLVASAFALPHASFAAGRVSASEISNVTAEDGTTATFTIGLDAPIIAESGEGYVTIYLSTSDGTEGSVSPSSITFAASEWTTTKTVTVTGVDDFVDDGDIDYTIVLSAVDSDSEYYNGYNPADVSVVNYDDENTGVDWESGIQTSEAGDTTEIAMTLSSQPTADVTIPVSSANTNEITVSVEEVTFTSENWNIAHTVTVTGVDDGIDDGDTTTAVVFGAATSVDLTYSGYDTTDALIMNVDNDTAGITVSEFTESMEENGETAVLIVVLNSQPTDTVTLTLTSNDQIATDAGTLEFTPYDWNIPQAITVSTINDYTPEDPTTGTIDFTVASTDPLYDAFALASISTTVNDDDFTLVTHGKYIKVIVNGSVVDRAKVGNKKLQAKHYALKHKQLYRDANYTTVSYLVSHKLSTELIVFRLTADNQLTKKQIVRFPMHTHTPLDLSMRATGKQITIHVGDVDTDEQHTYHLQKTGELTEVAE